MALPGFRHRGHTMSGPAHAGHAAIGPDQLHTTNLAALKTRGAPPNTTAAHHDSGILGLLPSPRIIFSLTCLYGAFGVALTGGMHVPMEITSWAAMIPAVVIERFFVTPLWKFMFRFEGTPSSSLEQLILAEATAVTPFRNQRGMVSVIQDGRLVQFRAELIARDDSKAVLVGDRLLVEDVDMAHKRLTVSIVR